MSAAPGPTAPLRWTHALALYVAFATLALVAYRGVLAGPFVSDDRLYFVDAAFTAGLTSQHVAAMFDPRGDATVITMNYAPVQLLLVALERSLFGDWTTGHHVLNVLLHAGNALLLVALLVASGAPQLGAAVAGLIFLLHPAQAEAVAWISQIKTLAAFALGFGALLLLWRRPALAAALFGLAVLTKFVVVTLVAVGAAYAWLRPGQARASRTWWWLCGWLCIALAIAWPQLAAFKYSGSGAMPAYADAGELLRSVAATGARYLVMAATGLGLSTWHEPPRASTWSDPWWLLALLLGAGLAARLLVTLRRRSEEAVFWIMACAGFAPVSQLVPFYFPLGDRYLYFILPGLLGGIVLWLSGLAASRRMRLDAAGAGGRLLLAVALVLAILPGLRTSQRALVFTSERAMDADALAHYPQGTAALYQQALDAAGRGDATDAVARLREAGALRPIGLVRPVHADPRLAPIRDTPEYHAYLMEVARERVDVAQRLRLDHPIWLRSTATAHLVLGEYDEAIALLERAMNEGGSQPDIMMELLAARQAQRAHAGSR